MRKILLPVLFLISITLLSYTALYSQSCVPTNLNNTIIYLSCNTPCTTLSFRVPHIKSTSTYTVTSIPYAPFPYLVATGGTEDALIYQDDKYSNLYTLPFPFCFYDSVYSKAVIGSNGLLTFDETNATTSNAYPITQTIPYAGGSPNSISPAYYPKASIMGAYSDLDPRVANSPADMKIQWRVEGTAPCRRFVVSFYHVGTFGADACTFGTGTPPTTPSPNTFQMVMFESTGLIEVYVENKTCTPSTNGGNAILGVQNWNRTAAVAAPGKNGTNWSSISEGYRFTPSGGASKFISSELLSMGGAVLAVGDTITTTAGLLDISFPNICPPPGSTQYVVRTTFSACPTGVNMVSMDTVTLSRNNTLPVTTVLTPTTCGNNTGSITINVIGSVGILPYQYSLNGGALQLSNVFNNLAAGTYTVFATDAGGCDTTYSVVITASSNLTSTVVKTNANCPGSNSGSLTVTPTSGVAPYTFSINAGPSQPTGVFNNLAAGTYIVTFTDALLCTGTQTVVIGPGTAIAATATSTATSCSGAADGSITVTPTTGVAPYTYSLDGGTFQAGNVFTGVTSGTHTIVVRDANNCIVSVPRTVTAGTSLLGSIFSTPVSCPGVNDGTVTLVPTNGVAPFTFTIDGGAPQASGTFTGLTAGLHQVVFTDINTCNGTRSINVGPGASASTGSSSTGTSCPGGLDGTITINTVPGAIYTLNPGGITNTTGIFTGLAAGTYTATFLVPPATCSGSVLPANIIIGSGPALTGTATGGTTSCPGVADGTVTVNSPATPGTTFTLNPGGITNTTGIFTGLAANTYSVTFVTAAGCSGAVSPNPVVTAGPALTSTFSQANPVCANINDGTISVIPQAGSTGPYTAILTGPGGPYTSTSASPVIFSNLAPGTYNFTYTTASGCTGGGGPVTLVTNAPIMTPVVLTMPLCNGNANGTATFSPLGGVAPYSYSTNAGATFQASNVITGLAVGPHTIRIKDNVGCIKDTTITLTQPTVLTSSAASNVTAGCSNNDGGITAAAAGGTAPYVYTIAGPAVNTSGASTGVFTGLASGNYIVTATDAKGCTSTATATVVLVDNMFLTLGADTTICVESSLTLNPQTNPETSVFAWTSINAPASTIANPSIKNAVVTPLDTSAYILNAAWGTCRRTDTIIVNVLHKPVSHAGNDTAICNISYAILRGSASNLSGTVNYNWTPATNVEFPGQAVTRVYPAGNDTTYVYTLTVTDNYGCKFSVTDQVNVHVQPPVPAYAGNDTIAIKGVPHQLFGSGGVSYLWSPPYPLNSATNQNPLATLENDTKFILQVIDVAGCIGYDTVFVQAYFGPNYYIPNAFSPNGDGLNDVFRPIPVGIVSTDYFRVFNRFGQVIFQTSEWLKGWDGTYKGVKQPIGGYIWIIKGKDRNGKTIEMKGTVMLIQ